jgi:hypothetical protein
MDRDTIVIVSLDGPKGKVWGRVIASNPANPLHYFRSDSL